MTRYRPRIRRAASFTFTAAAALLGLSGCLGDDHPIDDQTAATTTESVEIRAAAVVLAPNMLANGDFSEGGASWIGNFIAPATGAITYGTGTAKLGINSPGTQNYQVQLFQPASVISGKVYTYSFAARKINAGTRNISFIVETNAAPYDKDINRAVAIDNTWRTFSGTFTATSSRVIRVEIQAGLSDLDFEIDNVVVAPQSSGPAITTFSVPATSTDPTVPLTVAAADDVGVTGYYLGSWPARAPVGPTPPALDDPSWTATKPTSFTPSDSVGCTALVLFVKDAEGNISPPAQTSFCVVDLYEPDDAAATAKVVTVNASPQNRTSHDDMNHDWIKFTAVAGTPYTISVAHQTPFAWSYSLTWSALVSLYTASDLTSPVLEQRETSPGGLLPTTITFVAAYSGAYYVRYEGRHHYRLSPNETYTVAVTRGQLPANRLTNGDFASGGAGWVANLIAPATGSATFSGGTGRLNITTAGTANYHAQLYQSVPVIEGKVYSYSFAARKLNAGTRTITFLVETDGAPYDKDVTQPVPIDATWRTFAGQFKATSSRVVRIEIQAGLSDLDFEVDNVYLGLDDQAPVITQFSAPAQVVETPIIPLTIAATDNAGIAGYFLMSFEQGAPAGPETPAPDASGWTVSKPTTVTSNIPVGCLNVALFVKDFSGNVSAFAMTELVCLIDSYEPDDTSTTAADAFVNSPPQNKTSHQNADPDWATFPVEAGRTYTVTVTHVDPWFYAPSSLTLYAEDDGAVEISSVVETTGVNQPLTLSFVASYTGSYYALYKGRAHYRLNAKETYTFQVTSP